MFGLPANTLINQPLYKKAVFEKFNLKAASKRVKSDARICSSEREQFRPEVKAAERDRFDADISKMALVARISPATVPALSEGKDIKGFYVLQVELKHQDCDTKNILLLEEQIINREQHEKLLRQIETLEKRCRAEKQTRKRYELHQQIVKLKEELAI